MVVCIDDLERRGANLSLEDVFGIGLFLKEDRDCRVVFLLNEEKLGGSRGQFDDYVEKLFDLSVTLNPSADEAATIAIGESKDPNRTAVIAAAKRLDIRNIRILNQALQRADALSPSIAESHPKTQAQVHQTLPLAVWSFLRGENAPSFQFLRDYGSLTFYMDREKRSPAEQNWNLKLSQYGYTRTDFLDEEILNFVEHGYLDESRFVAAVRKANEQFEKADRDDAVQRSFDLFHNTFAENGNEIAAAFISAVDTAADTINVSILNGVVSLLKRIGHSQAASTVLAKYLERYPLESPRWDASDYSHRIDQWDPDVWLNVKAALNRGDTSFDLRSTLLAIGRNDAWNRRWLPLLASQSPDDYYSIFVSTTPDTHRDILKGATHFDNTSDQDGYYSKISESVRSAIGRLADESVLNAERASLWGWMRISQDEIDPSDFEGSAPMTVLERAEKHIQSISPDSICDDCLMLKLNITPRQHANHNSRELARRQDFHRYKGECSVCGGVKLVIEFRVS